MKRLTRSSLHHLLHSSLFWAVLLLLALPFVLFWPLWLPGVRHMTFAYGDFTEQYYPMRAFAAAEWRGLRLPLWDPYPFSGTPAAAASLYAAYYPFTLLLALWPHPAPFVALELEAILHLGLAGVFTLLFTRRLTGNLTAGVLAGIAFSLGGFLTSYPLVQLGILETAIWLPLVLWLLDGALARRSLPHVAAAGLALACALLAGHPQTFLYLAYLTLGYAAFAVWRHATPLRFALPALLLLAGIAAGGSAAQWLPSLELMPLSPRADLSYAAVANGFAPHELLGLLRANRGGQWSPLYVGMLPVALALLNPLLMGLHRRRHTIRLLDPAAPAFWLVVLLVALGLALGGNGWLYPLAHGRLPGFDLFRNQERAALLASFALAVLAAYGWAALPRAVTARRSLVVLLLALLFADLYHANFGLMLQPRPAAGYFPAMPLVQHLQSTGSADWRTSSEGLLPGDGNAGSVFGVRDVSGNSPLHIAAYDDFLAAVPEQRFWELLNVQHLLTRRVLDHGALAPVISEGDLQLYQVFVRARPAWVVHQAQVMADQAAALAAAGNSALDPWATVVLEQAPAPAPQLSDASETVELLHFSPQRVVIEADLAAPGVLISSEISYPGWQVWVNGQPAVALRAYGVLRAVALPAGQAVVEWRFRSLSAWGGAALSAATWLAVAGWLLHRRTTWC